MTETAPKVDYSDISPDKSFGRAPYKLCSLKSPGGRKLVDAFYAPRYIDQSEVHDDCPPWYWAEMLVKQTIRALRDVGWTVEPPPSLKDTAPEG